MIVAFCRHVSGLGPWRVVTAVVTAWGTEWHHERMIVRDGMVPVFAIPPVFKPVPGMGVVFLLLFPPSAAVANDVIRLGMLIPVSGPWPLATQIAGPEVCLSVCFACPEMHRRTAGHARR